MVNHTTNNDDRNKVIDLLKRVGEEIHNNEVLISKANEITDNISVEPEIAKIEEYEKLHVTLMSQLLRIFEKTELMKPFWPKLTDSQGNDLMLDLCMKLGNSFTKQYEDMRLHLYAVESKIGRYPKPPSPQSLKNAREALDMATRDLTRCMLKLANYYQISTLDW